MNIFSMEIKSNMCFAKLMASKIDTSKPPDDPASIISRPGIKISVLGQTEGTKVLEKRF